MRISRALALTLALTLVAASWASSPAQAVGETCRGQTATIVGEPHGAVTGTPGDDVIVTNGAEDVDAGDGDDAVCVTATAPSYIATVDAGAGDDTVDTTATREFARVTLGAGADRLDGGDGGHDVLTGSAEGVDAEYDTIRVLGEYDIVRSGQAGQPDPDDIDLGAGDGAISLRSEHPTGVLRADHGSPATLRVGTFAAGTWLIDQAAEQVTLDDQVWFGWDNLALEYVDAVPDARVGYRGTDAIDFLYLLGGTADGVDMGGAGDAVYVGRAAQVRRWVVGGSGKDTIEVVASRQVRADLRDGQFDRDGTRADVRDFEHIKVFGALTAVLHGTAGPNFLASDACDNRIRSGEGADRVYSGTSRGVHSQCRELPVDVKLFGGPGDDYLSAGSVNDHLYGGPGDDTAHGGNGHDVCRAEERVSCEA